MQQAPPSDIKKVLQALRHRFSQLEKMVARPDPAVTADGLEIDLNEVVSDLTYSLITSNATLAGIADIVLNYAKVFTRSEYGYVSSKLHLLWLTDAVLAMPVVGGSSLSVSYLGTFLVFLYIWMPYMILPIQAALERVPVSLIEASSDLGANPNQVFRTVILPLAFPGVVAGSIFTFCLTLGDYIIPGIIGSSRFFIGQAVYAHQELAGNIPLAAAFSVVPIVTPSPPASNRPCPSGCSRNWCDPASGR